MIPVLIIGKSGAGKSASLRNLPTMGTVVVNVLGKPLPFRSDLDVIYCDDYNKIAASIARGQFERCIIDDAGYLVKISCVKYLTPTSHWYNISLIFLMLLTS